MTIAESNETILPINQQLTRNTWLEIRRRIVSLTRSLTRATDYSEMIQFPDAKTGKQITSAIMNLIAATAEANHTLNHHQARRTPATAPKPDNPNDTNPNTTQQHKPLLALETPTTARIEDPAHS